MMEMVTAGGGEVKLVEEMIGSTRPRLPTPPATPTLTPMELDEWVKIILPPEMWRNVLENLKRDPESLLNCSGTCQTWNELLAEDKTDWLFPMVVPLLEKHLAGNELLACRRVSKKWKAGVDQFRQLAVHQWTPRFISYELIRDVGRLEQVGSGSYKGRNVFTRMEQVEGFHRQMADHPGNPFPSKSLIYQSLSHRGDANELNMNFVRDARAMSGRLVALLTTSGHHLSDFTYICGNLSFEVSLHVARALETLPNLTSFSFVHLDSSVIRGTTNAKALPVLPHLKCLHLRTECYLTLDAAREDAEVIDTFNALLVAYGRQLEQLEIDSEVFFSANYLKLIDLPPNSGKLISLKRLKVRNIQSDWCFFALEQRLLSLKLPALQQVSLHFFFLNGNKSIRLERCFELLNRWSSTLTEAHVLVEQYQLSYYPDYSTKDSAKRQATAAAMKKEKFQFLKVLGVCYSLLNSEAMFFWVVNKFPKLERLELHEYEDDTFSEQVSESESDDNYDEEEEPVAKTREEILDALWDVVPTLKEIVVWDTDFSGRAPKIVFHWRRADQRRINLCQ